MREPPAGAYFHAQARNNAWANGRLHAACATLPAAELAAPRAGFFPSLALTLNHVRLVDLYYLAALEGAPVGPDVFADHDRPPPFPEVRAGQAALDRRLVALAAALDAGRLARPVRLPRAGGRVQVERTDLVLLHLFQHQVHHRGQAHAMLSGAGVKPPQLDEFFLDDDAPLRAGEMAALGLEEGSGRYV